ncbi:tRNA (guanosine(37)-N1)-methyltransferase TrmD [Fluviispira multicolorata]|uniref:tRNA (guanine-N(1)-)-methyltransferase n=1 Tax=Fluviispira multicolorata TaxID=2654512 RepID=A0A833JBS9_9BACT|nr:tRNA (guanosine(37)-N1)-methyltransferase TrmD [Fluviispira multicolorata]KAB8029128.1 tRNA (guanosine(37)-N1)-methyltransferase TrmD [Fluviispira multicolorata]
MNEKLRFSALTLFPEMFETIKNEGVIARAIKNNIIMLESLYLRDFSDNVRKNVDDHPIGGGDGMVLRPDITEKAILSVKNESTYIINLTPSGKIFNNQIAKDLAQKKHILLLCGRYAGYDMRVINKYSHLNLSVGDFVLSGGELPAMCIIDTVARFLPGVLGNKISSQQDSFENGLLEAPQYTHPETFSEMKVPEILFSGNHKKIAEFNRKEQIKLTAQNRPDLILQYWDSLSRQEKSFVEKIWKSGK